METNERLLTTRRKRYRVHESIQNGSAELHEPVYYTRSTELLRHRSSVFIHQFRIAHVFAGEYFRAFRMPSLPYCSQRRGEHGDRVVQMLQE